MTRSISNRKTIPGQDVQIAPMRIIGPDDRQLSIDQIGELPANAPNPTEDPMAHEQDIEVTRLRMNHFRGWDNVDVELGPRGSIFIGKEATGKTSLLDGIKAAAKAVGIGPDAIRFDAPSGHITLDMVKIAQNRRTPLQIQRTIKRAGKGSIELVGSDSVPLPRPKEQIDAMFGERSADPMEVYKVLTDAKKLRALLMEACPSEVTADDLNKWCETTQEWNTDGHGQEVLTRVRESYESKRKAAGQVADQAKAAVALKAAEVDRLRVAEPVAISPDAAQTHVAMAEQNLAVLRERRRQAAEREAASEGTRARVAKMRAEAEGKMGAPELQPPAPSEVNAAADELVAASSAVEAAKKALEAAQTREMAAKAAATAIDARVQEAARLQGELAALIDQANELEQAIVAPTDADPQSLAEQMTAAEGDLATARELVESAKASARWRAAKDELAVAEKTQQAADAEWEKLQRIVKRLASEAPAELSARSNAIPGLEITPDAVYLDKRSLTVLSGSERMKFAVVLAKRMSGAAKILTVDGMEAISPAQQPEFVRMCLEDGWILFATVVSDGPLQIVDAYKFAERATPKQAA